MIKVSVFYASKIRQKLIELPVPLGTTVKEAITLSNIETFFPEIELTKLNMGIYSKVVTVETILTEGDRIEIYRPLAIDPKLARKKRAESTK